jgi:hypothetical protein
MEVAFTIYHWLNVILVGFFFGIGWIIAQAIYLAILAVLNRGRTQP